jgi:peptide/nickel transport system permease protein
MLIEAGLAFLGLGGPNVKSWGTMGDLGLSDIRTNRHVVTIPGAAIVLTVLALTLIGDGLNDALNKRAETG